jgi:hypothetical protein
VELLDTPGLGDEAAMTERTLRAVASVDAAVVVTSSLSPFSQTEQELLRDLLEHVDPSRLFVVLGHIDCVPAGQVERLVALVQKRVRSALGASSDTIPVRVFPVSQLEALVAKRERDPVRLQASRFEHFEAALERFLVRDRGVAVLQIANEAVLSGADELIRATGERLSTIDLEQSLRDAELARRETDLRQLGEAANALRVRHGRRALQAGWTGREHLGERARLELTKTIDVELDKLQFTEEEVTQSKLRHDRVGKAVGPAICASLEQSVTRAVDALVSWGTLELKELEAMLERLDALIEADRDAAGAPATSRPERSVQSMLGWLLGDVAIELEAAPRALKLSYEPASIGGTVRTLAANVAGNATVKTAWLRLQGDQGERLLKERTTMMAELQRNDYRQHLQDVVRREMVRLDLPKVFDGAWKVLSDKLALKVRGDTELVEKVCEIRPWELKVARQRARAECERDLERIRAARETAERARQIASERLAWLAARLGDDTTPEA